MVSAEGGGGGRSDGFYRTNRIKQKTLLFLCFAMLMTCSYYNILLISSNPPLVPNLNNNNEQKNEQNDRKNRIQHILSKYERIRRQGKEASFYFLHIPKTSGTGMFRSLIRIGHIKSRHYGPFYKVPQLLNSRNRLKVVFSEGFLYEPGILPHVLTMIRNPWHHVISQFMHCSTGEYNVEKRTKIRSIEFQDWLSHWVNVKQEEKASSSLSNISTKNNSDVETVKHRWHDPEYFCFIPINLQSWHLGFPSSKEELSSQYDVIGLVSRYDTSACLFAIFVTGQVPTRCNCSNVEEESGASSQKKKEVKEPYKRVDHGIKIHGDEYNTTRHEDEMISFLVDFDNMVYGWAMEIFEEQVDAIETFFDIKLCK